MSESTSPIGTPPSPVLIEPVDIRFQNGTVEPAILAYDGEIRTYVYPTVFDPRSSPVNFLRGAFLLGGATFKDMVRRAYLARRDMLVGPHPVRWDQYEGLLAGCSWHQEHRPAEIVDMEWPSSRTPEPDKPHGEKSKEGA